MLRSSQYRIVENSFHEIAVTIKTKPQAPRGLVNNIGSFEPEDKGAQRARRIEASDADNCPAAPMRSLRERVDEHHIVHQDELVISILGVFGK
jgi:hypothetical protein